MEVPPIPTSLKAGTENNTYLEGLENTTTNLNNTKGKGVAVDEERALESTGPSLRTEGEPASSGPSHSRSRPSDQATYTAFPDSYTLSDATSLTDSSTSTFTSTSDLSDLSEEEDFDPDAIDLSAWPRGIIKTVSVDVTEERIDPPPGMPMPMPMPMPFPQIPRPALSRNNSGTSRPGPSTTLPNTGVPNDVVNEEIAKTYDTTHAPPAVGGGRSSVSITSPRGSISVGVGKRTYGGHHHHVRSHSRQPSRLRGLIGGGERDEDRVSEEEDECEGTGELEQDWEAILRAGPPGRR